MCACVFIYVVAYIYTHTHIECMWMVLLLDVTVCLQLVLFAPQKCANSASKEGKAVSSVSVGSKGEKHPNEMQHGNMSVVSEWWRNLDVAVPAGGNRAAQRK